MRDRLRIVVTDAAAKLRIGAADGQPDGFLISLLVTADVPGPFTGDPGDIALTVDYSRIARFLVNDLPDAGPFPDLESVGGAIADYTLALDPRVLSVQITIRGAADGTPSFTLDVERQDG